MNTFDIEIIVNTLRDMDVADAGIRAALKKKGVDDEAIAAAVPKAARASFASGFYDLLVEGISEEDALAFLNDGTSDNVKKNEKHYMGLWALVERVRA